MPIVVDKEPDAITKKFGSIVERCVFCKAESRYWHLPTNNFIMAAEC